MTRTSRALKRALDLSCAIVGLTALWPVILSAAWLAARDTGESGIFWQMRIGRHGRPFRMFKIRTMRGRGHSTVTTASDPRITRLGRTLRRWKIDELPQLWNVLRGDMSIVGPRPDVAGYADLLEGPDRAMLDLRPGITGPATLKYRREEEILAAQPDPERYNREVLWPDKVRINCEYMRNYSVWSDLGCIWHTVRRR